MAAIIEGKRDSYRVENDTPSSQGHPRFKMFRESDGVLIATIERYEGRITTPIKGTRLIKNGKLRTFWKWVYTREGRPDCHRGQVNLLNETKQKCIKDIIWFVDEYPIAPTAN